VISLEQLKELARKNGLTVYQQEKDYFLKLFLYEYFRRYQDAVSKGVLASGISSASTGSARI